MTDRIRLDRLLVARGLYETRARAADAIRRGAVKVNRKPAAKPGQPVAQDAGIAIEDPAKAYVSRAALKLLAALEAHPFPVRGALCADIGASTGGFTQVLLERGAKKVFAVDAGHGQLSPLLRADARVVNLEGLNARDLTPAHIPVELDVIVSDVSFISLKKALPAALALARGGAHLAALIKPQFEAGREHIGKGGVVRERAVRAAVCEDIRQWLEKTGWPVSGLTSSPLAGADGNAEYLIVARKKEKDQLQSPRTA